MSTLSELQTHYDEAISDYATALNAFRDAYVNLAALERTLANGQVCAGHLVRGQFGPLPDVIFFRHTAATPNIQGDWWERIGAATNARLATYPTPDPE